MAFWLFVATLAAGAVAAVVRLRRCPVMRLVGLGFSSMAGRERRRRPLPPTYSPVPDYAPPRIEPATVAAARRVA
ncbi:hypothetical protein [Sphingomicrobium nitratireducens]|uniref:hypothetical protein n=1 Tax=Sphingomicrobium nitratireducens TaxID=2964666 RepID=UPI0022409351|nr:hypothetical protein [Sphingomicrobium nitratireducens]